MEGLEKLPKAWKEQTIEEKLDTLRGVLIDQRYVNSRVYRLEEQLRLLKTHDHKEGKVVLPVIEVKDNGYAENLAYTLDRLN
jgi:hypothetical protein